MTSSPPMRNSQAIIDEVEPVLHDGLKGPDGQTYFFTREWKQYDHPLQSGEV